jgi:hypothetical protein
MQLRQRPTRIWSSFVFRSNTKQSYRRQWRIPAALAGSEKTPFRQALGRARFQSRREGLYDQPLFNACGSLSATRIGFLGTLPEPALSAVEGLAAAQRPLLRDLGTATPR